ncbi:MAG: MFS transporter [Candidatus Latescibacteria bacterium]|nr:MFS transporter [Candidatus Latescibacterota bacterium]
MDSTARHRNFILLAVGITGLSFTFGVHFTIFNNFAVERIGLEPHQLGILEAIREVPGFLTAFMAGLTVGIAEPLLAGVMLFLFGIGFIAYGQVGSVVPLVAWSLIWSVGFHLWEPLSNGMLLSLAREGESGRYLGRMRSVGAIATIVGISLVYLLSRFTGWGYGTMYGMAGGVVALSALAIFTISRDIGYPTTVRLLIRRRYTIYYALTFLDGYRRQIFNTFAIFAMVRIYHVPVQRIAILMLVNNIAAFYLGPKVGRLIDRVGEYKMLTANYLGVGLVFLGYALVHRVEILFGLYIIDNILYLSNMALGIYIKRIADPEDMRPTLAMGMTVNHVAAVLMPLIGGFLWRALGYEIVFFLGAGVVGVAFFVVQKMKEGNGHGLTG